MALPVQVQVPAVMAAGRDLPGALDAQGRNDGLALINGLQERIRELEQGVLRGQVKEHEDAQKYEDQLFAERQQREYFANQLQLSQGQMQNVTALLEQRQQEINALQRRQVQDAAQIALGLREVAALTAQVQQEREQVRLLTLELQRSTAQIQQLNLRVQQFEQMQREILATVKQNKPESSVISDIFESALSVIWKGLNFHHPSFYRDKI